MKIKALKDLYFLDKKEILEEIKMKKNLYICNTYFHLLISIIKSMNTDEKCDLVISSDFKNECLFQDKELLTRLNNFHIFNDIKLFNHSAEEIRIKEKKTVFHKILYTYKMAIKNELHFEDYNNIYIYYEPCLISRMLHITKTEYNIIEDGTDFIKKNYHCIKYVPTIKNIIKSLLGFPGYGQSKYIKSIEVNDKSELPIEDKRIIENSKEKMFENLTENQIKVLLEIFLPNDIDVDSFNGATLIITQPLYEDHYLENEIDKINLYKKIIQEYAKNDKVIIKTHPRERTDYKLYFNNYKVIDFPFPMELLDFLNIDLEEIITVSSTSIDIFKNAKSKIYLGWEWLDQMRKRIKDE